jgi:hypothetical protein
MAVYSPTGSGKVVIDPVLTNISVGWPNEGLVGNWLLPTVPVNKQAAKYYIFGKEAWLPEAGDVRAPGTEANEIPGLKVSDDTFYAQEHSLQVAVTDEERELVDSPFSPDADGTNLVTSKIMLGRELAIKNLVTTAANYEAAHTVTLSGTAQWNDAASDPIGVIRTAKTQMHASLFLEPNVAVIPYQVMAALEAHPDIIERIKYSERAIVTSEVIAAVLRLPGRVIVPGVGIGTGNNPASMTIGYLWGKDVLLAYVPPRAGIRVPAFGYEFAWTYGGGQVQVVDRWREDRRKSDVIRCSRRYDLKLVAKGATGKSIAGYLIKNAIA